MMQKLGKYSIVEKLGEGAMGAVYKAYDEVLDRYVAIKTMAEEIKWDPELKLRFYREARSAAGLHHPNIVTIHDLGEEGKITYIVMELLQGQNLKDLIKDRAPLPLEKKLKIISQIADGLNHAHMKGIIHRDIKPGNIHLSPSGDAKILDFGIARIPSSDLTRSGTKLGTPIYMSPEQIRGVDYDARSDIFSAGIVFYELVAYHHPFRDKNIAKTLDNILFLTRLPFAEQFPEAPPGLWPMIERCLSKEPGQRWGSLAEVVRACRNLLHELDLSGQRTLVELKSSLPSLLKAAATPALRARLSQVAREVEEVTRREEKIDYLSLRRLMAEVSTIADQLKGMPPLESAAEPTPARPEAETPTPAPPHDESEERGRRALEKGREARGQGRLEEALELFRAAARDLGEEPEIAAAVASTEKEIEEQKRVRISRLLDDARTAMLARKYQEVVDALNRVLEIEPNREGAIAMRRQALAEIEAERAARAKKEEGEKNKAEGLRLLGGKKFRDALEPLRRAAELLGEDASLRAAIEQATAALREEEVQNRVGLALAKARKLLQKGEFEKARTKAEEARQISPDSREASDLMESIDRMEEERKRTERIADLLTRSREALKAENFDEASARAGELLELDAGNTEAGSLLARIAGARQASQLREKVEALLLQGREALGAHDFDAARKLCEEALALAGDNPAARDLLSKIEDALKERQLQEDLDHLLAQGQQAFLRGEIEEAERCAGEMLALAPDHAKAKDLALRAVEERRRRRREEIDALFSRAEKAVQEENFESAENLGREILTLEPQNAAVRNLSAKIEQTRQLRKKEQIDKLLETGRDALGRGDFAEATRRVDEVLAVEAKNREARTLSKAIARAVRTSEKAEAREKKRLAAEQRAGSPEPQPEPSQFDQTVILKRPPRRYPPKAVAGAAALAALIIAGAAWLLFSGRSDPAQDLAAQLDAARAGIRGQNYKAALDLLGGILSANPDHEAALALKAEAEEQMAAAAIEALLLEAQSLKNEGRLEESLQAIDGILARQPGNEPALAVQAELQDLIVATLSRQEQEAQVAAWVENAGRMLESGRLSEAKSEIARIARVRPEQTALPALRRRLAALQGAADKRAQEAAARQSRERLAALASQAEELFRKGQYEAAQPAVEEWLAAEPGNAQAAGLQQQVARASQELRAYEAALSRKHYDDALQVLARLEKLNPADPVIPGLRSRAESLRAAARVTLSVFRLAAAGTLLVDDQPVGASGEVENEKIPAGRRKITVRTREGREISSTLDLFDGQTVAYVYDSAELLIRPMEEADRARVAARKIREEVHEYQVEHRHGFLSGKCTGVLRISGLEVEYRASEKAHSFRINFVALNLTAKDEKLDFETKDKKWSADFRVQDASQADEIRRLWGRLAALIQ